MKTELQATIWKFILTYKQKTGEKLNYVELVKDDQYREDVLRQARDDLGPLLAKLADQVELGLDADLDDVEDFEDESESVLLAEAPDAAWSRNVDTTSHSNAIKNRPINLAGQTVNQLPEVEKKPADRYAFRLQAMYQQGDISLLHRRALDRFRQKNKMDHQQVLDIENRTRDFLQMPPLDWKQELSTVVKDLSEQSSTLSALKGPLRQTYVRPERLTGAEFERILNGDNNTTPEKTDQPKTDKRWLIVAGIAAVAALIIGLL